MNHLNSLILEGEVSKIEELNTVGATNFLELEIAVKRTYKICDETKDEIFFFPIHCYGNLAEFTSMHCKLQQGVLIVGRLQQKTWTDAESKKHSKVVVIAEHIEFKPFVEKK